MNGSLQGEHIFNAVHALISQGVQEMRKKITELPEQDSRITEGNEMIEALEGAANGFQTERANANYGTATNGDARNATRYGEAASKITGAVKQIISESASAMTQGYTNINQILNELEHWAVDTVARASRRAQVQNKNQFDQWYNNTYAQMYNLLALLRDTALKIANLVNAQ